MQLGNAISLSLWKMSHILILHGSVWFYIRQEIQFQTGKFMHMNFDSILLLHRLTIRGNISMICSKLIFLRNNSYAHFLYMIVLSDHNRLQEHYRKTYQIILHYLLKITDGSRMYVFVLKRDLQITSLIPHVYSTFW